MTCVCQSEVIVCKRGLWVLCPGWVPSADGGVCASRRRSPHRRAQHAQVDASAEGLPAGPGEGADGPEGAGGADELHAAPRGWVGACLVTMTV